MVTLNTVKIALNKTVKAADIRPIGYDDGENKHLRKSKLTF